MIERLLRELLAELLAAGVPAPLGQRLTLAAVWVDLARLAGEEVPADVLALLDGPAPRTPANRDD